MKIVTDYFLSSFSRYGWFSNAEATFRAPVSSAIPSRHDANMNIMQESSVGVLPAPSTDPPKEANGCVSMNTVNASRTSDHTEAVLWENPETVVTDAEVVLSFSSFCFLLAIRK